MSNNCELCIVNCELQARPAVLLVEDNEKLNMANSRVLKLSGFDVYTALSLEEARAQLAVTEPDVILLDVMLPDGDGFEFCDSIRSETNAHIIFLTAKVLHEDVLRGLRAGGDDYITKPFHPEELVARVAAAMRRRNMDKTTTGTITKGSLSLDIIAAQAYINGINLRLTPKEFALLLLLVQNEGVTMSAEHIFKSVWGQPLNNDKNALQTAISKLRAKIEQTGYDIVSYRSKGYKFSTK